VLRRSKSPTAETMPIPEVAPDSSAPPDSGPPPAAPFDSSSYAGMSSGARGRTTPPPTGDALWSDLRGLAATLSRVDAPSAERFERLAEAMIDPVERDRWADVDLRRAFHTERLAHIYAIHREGGEAPPVVDFVDKLRNVLVLAPIMLTWAALAEATRAYSKFIAQNPEQIGTPFLLLWQRGFGGQASWHSPSFAALAITDALIILVIISLTFFSHGRREEHDDNIMATARDFQAHLDNALGDATIRLAIARTMRPNVIAESIEQVAGRFEASAQELLTRLRMEHDRLDAIAQRREREFSDFAVFASGMRAGAEESHRVLLELRQISAGLNRALEDLIGEVGMASEQQRGLLAVVAGLERSVAGTTQSDAALARSIADAARGLAESSDRAIAGAEQAARAGQVASEAVRSIAEVAVTLSDGQTRIESVIAEESAANARLAHALESSLTGVGLATRTMSDIAATLLRVRDDLMRFGDLAGEQATTLQALMSEQGTNALSLQQAARDLGAVGTMTAQRQKDITDESVALIQRIDTLVGVLARAAAGLPTPEMIQEAVGEAVRREIGPGDASGGRGGTRRGAGAGRWDEPR
jgi:hypothetical protein